MKKKILEEDNMYKKNHKIPTTVGFFSKISGGLFSHPSFAPDVVARRSQPTINLFFLDFKKIVKSLRPLDRTSNVW